MLTEERQRAIQAYLTKKGNASVAELYKLFDVSEMTIRRDLKDLEKKGLLRRTYGGAYPTEPAFFEMSFHAKYGMFIEEKRAIAAACAGMVKNGDVVFLDSGTTTLEVARMISSKNITVITNDLNIVFALNNASTVNLFVSGGEVRRGTNNLIGSKALSFYDGIHGSILFMGVEGVDAETGYTIPDLDEVLMKKQMMKSVDRVVVVADKSKIGRHTLGVIGPLGAAHMLVTDAGAPAELLAPIQEKVAVTVAQPDDAQEGAGAPGNGPAQERR